MYKHTLILTGGFGLVFAKMLLLAVPMTMSAPSSGTIVDNPYPHNNE